MKEEWMRVASKIGLIQRAKGLRAVPRARISIHLKGVDVVRNGKRDRSLAFVFVFQLWEKWYMRHNLLLP